MFNFKKPVSDVQKDKFIQKKYEGYNLHDTHSRSIKIYKTYMVYKNSEQITILHLYVA